MHSSMFTFVVHK